MSCSYIRVYYMTQLLKASVRHTCVLSEQVLHFPKAYSRLIKHRDSFYTSPQDLCESVKALQQWTQSAGPREKAMSRAYFTMSRGDQTGLLDL